MGKPVGRVERERCVAMGFCVGQGPRYALGRGEIEQILRHVGAGGDRAGEQLPGAVVQPKQAEDAAQRIQRVRRGADHCLGLFGRGERVARLAAYEQALGLQDERDRVAACHQRGTLGADDGGIGSAALQGSLCQERPGSPLIGIVRKDFCAHLLGRSDVAARKGASCRGYGWHALAVRDRAHQCDRLLTN